MGLRDTGRKLYTGTKSRVFSLCYDGVRLDEDSVRKLLTGLKPDCCTCGNPTSQLRSGDEHIILMRASHCDDSNLDSNRKNHSKQTEYNIGVVNNNNNNNNNNRRKQQHIRNRSHFQDPCHSTWFHFNQLGLLHRHRDSSVSQHVDDVTTQREY